MIPRLDEFPITERAPAELEILSMGHEDYYGLWDIGGGVNTVVPGLTPAHMLRLAQAVAFDLLERGLLELTYGHKLENEGGQIVAAQHREAALADLASWDPYARAEADPYYTITGTPAGVQEYYRLGWAAAEGREPQPPSPPRCMSPTDPDQPRRRSWPPRHRDTDVRTRTAARWHGHA